MKTPARFLLISFTIIIFLSGCKLHADEEAVIEVPQTSAVERNILKEIFRQNPDNQLRWDTTETNLRNWKDLVITQNGHVSGLYLASKGLTILPREVADLEYLTILDIEDNRITSLPSDIQKIVMLEQLLISRNHLRSMPVEIGQLKKLELLRMDHNQIQSIPAEIGDLSQLRWLYLHNNEITSVPRALAKLSNLESLTLHHNSITLIPQEICDLGTTLTMSFNIDNNVICE